MLRALSLMSRVGARQAALCAKKDGKKIVKEFFRDYSVTSGLKIPGSAKRKTFFLKNQYPKLTLIRGYAPDPTDPNVSLRQVLADVVELARPDSYSTVNPALQLPYDSESQMHNVFLLAKAFAVGTGDKKRERISVVYGISGAGKTRFAKELPGLLKQACDHPEQVRSALLPDKPLETETTNSLQATTLPLPQTGASPSSYSGDDVLSNKLQSLKAALANCKQIYIEWRHNGQVYSEELERSWPSSVRLGLRVAAQHWFPNVNFNVFRERMQNNPYLRTFTLFNVLEAISQEDPTISAVYITLDEYQTTTQIAVPSESAKIGTITEPLSRSLARALAAAARMAGGKFFVFGTLVGTSVAAEDIVTDMTDDTFARVAVQRLTSQNVRNIINRMNLNGHPGADWLALKGFDALIKIVAGIPRAVELLVLQMNDYKVLPASIDIQNWRTAILTAYETRFNTAAVLGKAVPKTWPLLLGVAGYNVSSLDIVAGTRDAPLTVGDLEKAGFLACIDKPVDNKWEKYYMNCHSQRAVTVLDVPLPLLAMMDRQNSLDVYCPDPPRTFTEAEGSSLKNLLRPLVVDINLNPALLEKVMLAHFLLRWNVFNFADNNKHILAADFFIGGIFNPEFGTLRFVKEKKIIEFTNNPARGVWATMNRRGRTSRNSVNQPPSVTDSVELMHGAVLKFRDMSPQSRGVFFSGTNLFDSHVRLWVREGRKKRIAIIWLDAKHTGTGSTDLTPKEVTKIIKKRKFLQEKLPQYLHLAVIYTKREYKGDVPDDPYTCIIAKDGMSFSMSPFMKWLLMDNI